MFHIGTLLFEFGLLSFFIGILLLVCGFKYRDTDTKIIKLWFTVLGIVLMAAGMIIPI
jgi:hypothetical protein